MVYDRKCAFDQGTLKKVNSSNLRDMRPVFCVWEGFLVMVSRACAKFRESKLIICNTDYHLS